MSARFTPSQVLGAAARAVVVVWTGFSLPAACVTLTVALRPPSPEKVREVERASVVALAAAVTLTVPLPLPL